MATSDEYQKNFIKKMMRAESIEVPSMKEVEAIRALELMGLHVDVAKRDGELDSYAWNIIVRLGLGKGNMEKVGKAVGITCRKMFGDQKSMSQMIDFVFMDQAEIKKRLGKPLDRYDNFLVEIKWPASQLYDAKSLKEVFMRELSLAMSS